MTSIRATVDDTIPATIEPNLASQLEIYYGLGASETHGKDGPFQISSSTCTAPKTEKDFIQFSVKSKIPETADIQGLDTLPHATSGTASMKAWLLE